MGHHYEDEIATQLHDMGIPANRIIRVDQLIHQLEIQQYFDLPELNHDKKEIFVDAGAYTGDTIENFVRWTEHFEKIFAFEPDPENRKECQSRVEKLAIREKVKIFPCGLGKEEGMANFESGAESSSRIGTQGSMSIPITTVDAAVKDERVTFIKMDIEGAELATLRGAANTIKKHHPKLAICLYHKPEDILEIPSYILSLDRSYRLFLRHYALQPAETVLYCI